MRADRSEAPLSSATDKRGWGGGWGVGVWGGGGGGFRWGMGRGGWWGGGGGGLGLWGADGWAIGWGGVAGLGGGGGPRARHGSRCLEARWWPAALGRRRAPPARRSAVGGGQKEGRRAAGAITPYQRDISSMAIQVRIEQRQQDVEPVVPADLVDDQGEQRRREGVDQQDRRGDQAQTAP